MRARRLVLPVMAMLLLPALPAASWPVDRAEITISEVGGVSTQTEIAVEAAVRYLGASSVTVHAGSLRMLAVTRGESDVQRPDPGFGYPMSVAAVDPREAQPLLGTVLARILRSGEVVMGELSARLRGARAGDVVALEGWNGAVVEASIGAIVPDSQIEWSEILISAGLAARLGFERPSRIEVWHLAQPNEAAEVLRGVEGENPVRVRIPGELASGVDFTLPTAMIKHRFGEFSFRPTGRGDSIEVDDGWLDANIVDVNLDRLGPFKCHRAVVPYLRSALAEAEVAGLVSQIDTADFQAAGGCFNARLMRGGDRGFALSRHAWGVAIDINPTTNPYGGPVRLDDDLGQIFRRWGFAWGAGWLQPDGMHFEWTHIPRVPVAHRCSSYLLRRSARANVGWEVYARRDRCSGL